MTDPYQLPDAPLLDGKVREHRFIHSVVSFSSGLITIPLVVFTAARLMFGDYANGGGNAGFWGFIGLGSFLAAVLVYPFRRIPLWAAAALGPIAVLLVIAVWTALSHFFAT